MISSSSSSEDRNYLREVSEGCTLTIRVQPGAKRTAIAGIYGERADSRLKIALQAPPVEGRANKALIAFIAKTFGLSASSVRIVSGLSFRSKTCLLNGLRADQARKLLDEILSRGTSG